MSEVDHHPVFVLACDEAYAMPLATTLRSLVDSNPDLWPLDAHVLCDGFRDETRRKVLRSLPSGSASLQWHQVEVQSFGGFFTASYISKMTYARLLLPRVLSSEVTRLLYLDTDLLVLHNLSALWATDLEGAVLGAVEDLGLDPAMKKDEILARGLPRVRDYFNAGVLLIDMQRWRTEQISERAVEYLHRNPRSPFADQDALNLACDGRWKKLPARWNFQDHYATSMAGMDAALRPGIIHFVAKGKPWIPAIPSVNADFYDGFRRRTRFARSPLERGLDRGRSSWASFKRFLRGVPSAS